ncbi:MAG: C-terminal target protein, partial [Verrucomicrobiales bacterium]|nr:C-terminal target protein [Verrucomicrobiales bacterium]
MKLQTSLRWVCFWSLLLAFVAPSARAQVNLGATLTSSLFATQGETITYTAVITNRTSSDITGVVFNDLLDPNTTLVPNSINTSPLAFPDSYPVLGNVQITVAAPGVLANDVDPDGVGPALTVTAGNITSANGGNVVMSANGGFSYNPPRGFKGTDTFTYILNDGEGFTDTGKVSLTVTGMVWFVNSAAAPGGDGRLSNPFNTLAAFAAINNNSGNNPGTNDSIFLYSGSYTGPLTLLNNQKLIGQGATASISATTGLTPPPGSAAFPATSGLRPAILGNNGLTLASGNLVRGLNFNITGGTALGGGSVGSLTVLESAVTNTAGVGVSFTGGALNVALNSLSAAGGANGILLANTTGSFAINGDGTAAQNGTGGTIQNTTGNAVQLNNVANVSLSRMNINNSAANGIFGLAVNGLVIDWCSLNNNGDATDESGIRLGDPVGAQGLIGSLPAGANPTRIANTLVRASGEMNVAIFNNGGTLAQLEVTNVVSKDTRTRPLGADGFYFETRGNAIATVNFTGCSFSNNFTQGIQASAVGQSVLNVNVTNCGFTNNNEGIVLGNANDADIIFDINNNRFFNNLATGASGSAIAAVNATTVTPAAIYSGKIRNNTVSGGGIDNHLVTALFAGAGQNTLQVAANNINAANAQFSGIFLQAGETGAGNLNASVTVTGNTVSLGALGSHGILVQSRITAALCAEINGNTSTTAGAGLFGINVRQRDTSTFRLPGLLTATNNPATIIAFLQGKNPASTITASVATTYVGGAACTLPLFAMPLEQSVRSAVVELKSLAGPTASLGWAQHDMQIDPVRSSNAEQGTELTADRLKPILAAARQRWAATGLSLEQLAVLDSLRFEVTNLAGWYLGASSGRVVQLDRLASGYGWFIDSAPTEDTRFAGPAGRIDLLSAVLHEMGHQLGLPDDYTPAARGDVMYGFLAPG